MSFDLNLATLCDHVVYKEIGVMEVDARTIRLTKPLAASKITLYASDNVVPNSMYDIVNDGMAFDTNLNRMIHFKKAWRSPNDLFEVTYVTILSYCTKCSGSNYLDDVSFDVKGGLLQIRDEFLLMQNVEKFIITKLNSNPFNTFIGTSITGLIGTRISNVNFLITQMISEITNGLKKLQDLQNQYRATGRSVTPGEMLQIINNVTVIQDQNDPTVFRADITVTAESGQTVEFAQFIRMRG